MRFLLLLLLIGLASCMKDNSTRDLIIQKGLDPKGLATIGGRSYFFGNLLITFSEAHTICNDLGMVLVSIETEEEQNLLSDYMNANGLGNNFYSTSLSKLYNNSKWMWISSGIEMKYSNWETDNPNYQGDEYGTCVYIAGTSGWSDISCTLQRPFLCEQRC